VEGYRRSFIQGGMIAPVHTEEQGKPMVVLNGITEYKVDLDYAEGFK